MSAISSSQTSITMVNENLRLWVDEQMRNFRPSKANALKALSELALSNGQSLRSLLKSSSGLVAPGQFRTSDFRLGPKRDGTETEGNPGPPEKKMCREIWEQENKSFDLSDSGPAIRIHSYEVPLVQKRSGRKIDLLASSDRGYPVIIEAKFDKSSLGNECNTAVADLFRQFMQGLCYAVTMRHIWNESPKFREAWSALPRPGDSGHESLSEKLDGIPIPVVLAANSPYWKREFKWGDQQKHWHELESLVCVAESYCYPVYVGCFNEFPANSRQWKCKFWPWSLISKPSKDGSILPP